MIASIQTRKNLALLKHLIIAIFLSFFGAVFSGKSDLLAQNLTLFEEIESLASDNTPLGSRRNSAGGIISEPDFTLIGTARFGNYYSVLIGNGNESSIRLDEISGSMTFIPGYPGYQVIGVSSGEISIRYPDGRDCVSIKVKGISCGEDNVAKLRLPNAPPIKSTTPYVAQSEAEAVLQSGQGNTGQNVPKNPFAALLEEASNSDLRSEGADSFTPRRISPEDVPSGMRVVSTPFGDRLVEE